MSLVNFFYRIPEIEAKTGQKGAYFFFHSKHTPVLLLMLVILTRLITNYVFCFD